LSGLIIEHLEAIPRAGTSVLIEQYPIEVVQVQENRVRVARLLPRLNKKASE
jgi:Mg2+/Co2+ transporter CorB